MNAFVALARQNAARRRGLPDVRGPDPEPDPVVNRWVVPLVISVVSGLIVAAVMK